MRRGISEFFQNIWKYIWPLLITIGATLLCYLFMSYIQFDNLRDSINNIIHAPTNFLFGSDNNGILIRSFWGFDIGNWFNGLFDDLYLLKVICFPLILLVYVAGFVLGGLAQLFLIILGGIFVALWFILSFIIGTVFELLIIVLPGLSIIAFIILIIMNIKNEGQEEPIGENLVLITFTLLQLALSIGYYVMFAKVF